MIHEITVHEDDHDELYVVSDAPPETCLLGVYVKKKDVESVYLVLFSELGHGGVVQGIFYERPDNVTVLSLCPSTEWQEVPDRKQTWTNLGDMLRVSKVKVR